MMKTLKHACAIGLALCASAAFARPAYDLVATVPLGAPDRWDYVTYDAGANRVYVAHGDRVTVVDSSAGAIVGQIEGVPGGTHGIGISAATGQGFTDDGKAGLAVAFDPKTLKIVRTIPAAPDADAIAIDGASKHVFVIEGDSASITVIDPANDVGIATINVGEKLEFAVSDDAESLFVAGEEKGDLVRIDTAGNRVVAHYPGAGCTSPHGLAIDKGAHRLFMGCANGVMLVFDGTDGHVVATLPIGRGNDAMAYDPVRRRVFSSNGADGTISVFQQVSADRYVALEPITTRVSGRTMSLDPRSGRLFVAAATTTPATTPSGRPRPVPGSLGLLIFAPSR